MSLQSGCRGTGVNGCASVTGGILAIVLAASLGLRAVWMLSVAIYAVGVALLLWSSRAEAWTHQLTGASSRRR